MTEISQKGPGMPEFSSAEDLPEIANQQPLIIIYSEKTALIKQAEALKTEFNVIRTSNENGFIGAATANRSENPILIIDIGLECCSEEVIGIAEKIHTLFPSATRIATGKSLREVAKLQFHHRNACDVSKIHNEIVGYLKYRKLITQKQKILD